MTTRQRHGPIGLDSLVTLYRKAKEDVIVAGYEREITWQSSLEFDNVTESAFLREMAWVVLSSGFRESVVRKCFASLSAAFLEWNSADEIVAHHRVCRKDALKVFGSRRKIDAITDIVEHVAEVGIEQIKSTIRCRGVTYLQELPFLGPVTSYHLAKNLGLDVVKPDRHLVRMAVASGHSSPDEMCARVATEVGERVAVIDLVLWRYATLNDNYENEFALGQEAAPT